MPYKQDQSANPNPVKRKRHRGISIKKVDVDKRRKRPVGRPRGRRAVITMKYLKQTQGAVPPERFAGIIDRVAHIAETTDDHKQVLDAAKVLTKVFMPPDPANFIQMFAPHRSIRSIQAELRELREARTQYVDLIEHRKKVEGARDVQCEEISDEPGSGREAAS